MILILLAAFIKTLLSLLPPYISMFATFLWRLLVATFNWFIRALVLPPASTCDRVFACGILINVDWDHKK
jgi:hypothetical protein